MPRVLLNWTARIGIACWLGLVLPMLCVPGLSSDHDHGAHLVFHEPHAPSERPALQPFSTGFQLEYLPSHSPAIVAVQLLLLFGLIPGLPRLRPPRSRGWRLFTATARTSLFVPPALWRPPRRA